MSTGTQTNEVNAKIKTQLAIVKAKINNCSTYFKYMSFYILHSLNHYVAFMLKEDFLFYRGFLLFFFQPKLET